MAHGQPLRAKTRITPAVAALTAALLAYLVPIHSSSHVSWSDPGSHRQWYKQARLVSTGYAYPSRTRQKQ
jgi:hypothetical protein